MLESAVADSRPALRGLRRPGVRGRGCPARPVAAVGVGSVGLSAVWSSADRRRLPGRPPPGPRGYVQTLWTWMDVGDFTPGIGFYLDALSLVMIFVVTFVGFLIHLYSAEYMERRRGLQPLLRLHEPVRRLDADPGAGRQPAAAVPGLGRRGAVQLPADRLLVQGPGQRPRGAQGLRRHARRRHGAG